MALLAFKSPIEFDPNITLIVGICWRTLLARGKSSATHGFLCAIKGHRVSGGIRAAVAQGTVASAKRIMWDSLLRKTMANTKERIDALEAQIQSMFKCDQDALGILKQFSLRLDALEVNLEATDNARYAENMDWEGKFQELQDRVVHHTRHTEVDRLFFFFMEGLKPWARTELNRRRVQRGEQYGSQSRHPPAEEQTDAQDYEEEDVVGAFPRWCNAVTTQVGNPEESSTGEKPKDMPPKKKSDVPGKGLSQSDARWQKLLAEFNFMLEYRASSTNSVADALNRRAELDQVALMAMNAIVRADSRVAINIGKKIRKALTRDPVAQQLLKLIESGKTRQFWQEDGLLMTKGRWYWGMPQDIVSDRDSRFTGNFWTELFKLFGSQLSMSSSYHPESAGQTERFNSMLEEYLRHFVSATQKNWVKLLDVAQLCFNSRKSSSTGKSAFEIMNGQQPLLPHTVNVPNAGKSPRAISSSEEWRQNIDLAHSYLEKAARRMKKHADKNRRSQEFNMGDKIMQTPPGAKSGDQDSNPKRQEKRVAEAVLNDRVITASRKRHQEYLVKTEVSYDLQFSEDSNIHPIFLLLSSQAPDLSLEQPS
ncbi:hypothetical protein RJ640_007779 [Escallonia rubra]|uniref:Integrase catalytic domain-containing protein n=1 Tax=Escallonia rubra TaxID=112253 RepID=A0AA88SFW2_9ASTE|nr:hypothetical protein RJ640_007779 [Escallonia rubra]